MTENQQYLRHFAMPTSVKIMARSSSITNSFVNGIIPVVWPSAEEVRDALQILGMLEVVTCAYCGDPHTEWDHFRPLVVGQRPTGFITEIYNLVPACGKCNQSKGNKNWHTWIRSGAPRSPASRGVIDLDTRVERLHAYEAWGSPRSIDFVDVAGEDLWHQHWQNHARILELMREAETLAGRIRERVETNFKLHQAVSPPQDIATSLNDLQ